MLIMRPHKKENDFHYLPQKFGQLWLLAKDPVQNANAQGIGHFSHCQRKKNPGWIELNWANMEMGKEDRNPPYLSSLSSLSLSLFSSVNRTCSHSPAPDSWMLWLQEYAVKPKQQTNTFCFVFLRQESHFSIPGCHYADQTGLEFTETLQSLTPECWD